MKSGVLPCYLTGKTEFARLSHEAQNLIVSAMLGEFKDIPPEIADSVRAEIAEWAREKPSDGETPCEQ